MDKITNDVHQGGIFSPKLFCKYTDELSRSFFTRKILLKNQQNSTHKKKIFIHIYTEENKTTYNKPTTNSLSLAIYIKSIFCIIYLS